LPQGRPHKQKWFLLGVIHPADLTLTVIWEYNLLASRLSIYSWVGQHPYDKILTKYVTLNELGKAFELTPCLCSGWGPKGA